MYNEERGIKLEFRKKKQEKNIFKSGKVTWISEAPVGKRVSMSTKLSTTKLSGVTAEALQNADHEHKN